MIVLTKNENIYIGWGHYSELELKARYLQAVDVRIIESNQCEQWHREERVEVSSVIYLKFFECRVSHIYIDFVVGVQHKVSLKFPSYVCFGKVHIF